MGKLCEKTLVVEDDGDNRELLIRLLRRNGVMCDSASTLAEALKKLAAAPKVVLLDMHLSDGHGKAILEQIRSSKLPTAVAIVTGAAEPEALDELKAFAPYAVFIKPIRFDELLTWVREAQAN